MIGRALLLRAARMLVLALVLVLAALGTLSLRALIVGQNALEQAEQAFDRGDLRESVRQARRAAGSYVPFAPHVDAAYQRLIVIARGAEAFGQRHVAAFAWNAVRAAAIEGSAVGVAPRPELEQANKSLARIASRLDAPGASSDPKAERHLLTTLERPGRFSTPSMAALAAGLLLVLLGLCWVGLFGITSEGVFVTRRALVGFGFVIVGAACWTLTVYQA
jgi:HAMP domain-containing protein